MGISLLRAGQVAELAGEMDELDGVPDGLVEFKVEGVQADSRGGRPPK